MTITELLRSDDEQDFNLALNILTKMPSDEAIRHLEALSHESNGELRCRAIDGLSKFSPEMAELLSISYLSDPEWFVRVNAIDVLSRLKSRSSSAILAKLLATDPDEVVRSWAAFALGHVGDESVLDALRLAANTDSGADHEGRPIRETAIGSINMIQSRIAHDKNRIP